MKRNFCALLLIWAMSLTACDPRHTSSGGEKVGETGTNVDDPATPGGSGDANNPGPVTPAGQQEIVAYYQTWSAGWASDPAQHSLAKLPPYVTTVLLSFVKPETSYTAGQNTWANTGLDFSADFAVVKQAIALLKSRNPGTKVLLSIGGATYTNWAQGNPAGVAALVKDLGADGADLDYEPTDGGCKWASGESKCEKDAEFISVIQSFRAALPRPLLITTASWSTGAFGTAQFPASQFSKLVGPNFGLYINPLKQVGTAFDAIYIMSYDAGGPAAPAGAPTEFSPAKSFEAYRALYSGPLMLGVEIPPEAWGGHVSTPAEAQERAAYVLKNGGHGMMMWSIQKPTASSFAQAMCQTLLLKGCDQALP